VGNNSFERALLGVIRSLYEAKCKRRTALFPKARHRKE